MPPCSLQFPLSFFRFDSLMSHSFALPFPFICRVIFSLLLSIPQLRPLNQWIRNLIEVFKPYLVSSESIPQRSDICWHHLLPSSGRSPSGAQQQTPFPQPPLRLPCKQLYCVGSGWAAIDPEKTGIFTSWGKGFTLLRSSQLSPLAIVLDMGMWPILASETKGTSAERSSLS